MCVLLLLASFIISVISSTSTLAFEADCLPELDGFQRDGTFDSERWLDDGWFFQEITVGGGDGSPYSGQRDFYRGNTNGVLGEDLFLEWRMMTDAPNSEVDMHNGGPIMILAGGPVNYHFNIASGLVSILRGFPYPTQYFDIEPGVPHDYRLEVFGDEYFEFTIDGEVMDSGEPEDLLPTQNGELIFGARYYLSGHTTQWDYVRFGTIPEPASFLLLGGGTAILCRRRRN